ncbi:hypothetical protein AOCH_006792 [Aspergillus ochraceoroseus]|uniref:Transmembrane protein n=1 Tax=Aspergillus ochraceoroseus TaxID=138278 RepID=A0A0F8XJL5_9EURO|nr:hypothetical protein AOCH_006792 [Aspergillus ochraceoroseus]
MVLCWIIGLALALGHHFYYYSLNDTIVGDQNRQAWSSRIGTGLAFLTKTFLTTAVGIACVQNLWWILRLTPMKLSTLDSMLDIRGSIFNFFDLHVWLRGPNVAILGLISWLIPIVTVVTPSTLSIQSTVGSNMFSQPMPQIEYTLLKYFTLDEGGVSSPTPSVIRLVTGTIIQGTIPNIPAPAINSSYQLNFTAPLIQCTNSSTKVRDDITHYVHNKTQFYIDYIAFSPTSDNITFALDEVFYYDSPSILAATDNGNTSADVADKLVIAVNPYMTTGSRVVVECGMYNASYTANFDYTNGEQSIEIVDLHVLNRVPKHDSHTLPAPANENQLFAYTSIMDTFKTALEGLCWASPDRCTDTQIYTSSLVNSKEIWELVYGDESVGNVSYRTLPRLVEVASELGRNITLSFFSNDYFLQNTSQAKTINVTVYQNQTKYSYAQRNLLIAYGVAVVVSLLCVIAGFLTMVDNGFAFTDSFSTILRATRNSDFDDIVPVAATTGADPLPRSVAKTRVQWMPSSGGSEGIAGLKPLPADDDEKKKYKQVQESGPGTVAAEDEDERVRPLGSLRAFGLGLELDCFGLNWRLVRLSYPSALERIAGRRSILSFDEIREEDGARQHRVTLLGISGCGPEPDACGTCVSAVVVCNYEKR